ncbi:DUF533 domain-containing protein [Tropicimonas sp.]|uniref:DUF533 domain-containing protein n=1 Tax=Tropicimonas sp. TaxID=2067044 RepID=UPI003A88B353
MSFVKALAAVAMGFAAAKGVEKYKDVGGMRGLQDLLKGAGTGPAADQLGKIADQYGIPGGADKVKSLLDSWGKATASATEAGAAGLGSLMASMRGAAEAGTGHAAEMVGALVGETPISDATEEQAKLMIRAMIQAAKADGEIDEVEMAHILGRIGELDEEESAFVEEQLRAPLDINGLAFDAGSKWREQVYSTSLGTIRADSEAEKDYLRRLATALGLTQPQRDAIHARMGLPPIAG